MPHANQFVVVRHPEVSGVMVTIDPAVDYDSSDAIVRTYPQFFASIDEPGRIVESVSIERATAEPGQKRTRTRSK